MARVRTPPTPSAVAAQACAALPLRRAAAERPLYIGEVARLSGASVKAIRLYESMGLLGTVARLGVYRVYTERHIVQVRLIKQAQALGLTLADMGAALRPGKGQPDWTAVAQQVAQQRQQVAQEIARLQALDRTLQAIGEELAACVTAA